jgi:glucuronate isomerase
MAATFIHDDFLLSTPAARELYHRYAADQPIIDYHNHLSPQAIAEDRKFNSIFDLWIDGDHYKWRAMRANGIPESLVTGSGDPKEKFRAFAATIPHTLRNPLYHWTHLELKRFFDIDDLLSSKTADAIWDQTNQQLASRDDLSVRGILKKFNVTALCTTDDPTADLQHHIAIDADDSITTGVYPAFRPDWAMFVDRVEEFNPWVDKLGRISGTEIGSFDDFLDALRKRHDFFHEQGARLSDHGLEYVPDRFCSQQTATAIFDSARGGKAATAEQFDQFSTFMLLYLAKLDAEKGWTNQFHMGVWRNNNTRLFQQAGRDLGCDSIGDTPQGRSLGNFLDRLDQEDALPKTIVYNLNPKDNYLISSMIGNFQRDVPGKMQFGSGWWFLDQKEGMQWQLNTLSNMGLLSRFVGMLTDSRSFLSFTRHEYFRRILCELIGTDVENGELPNDMEMIGDLVSRICYQNAKDYLGLVVS